jgi:hypothetical protein
MQLFVCSVYITKPVRNMAYAQFQILILETCRRLVVTTAKRHFLNFTEAIRHSTSSHDPLVLEVRNLELNSSTGKIGYRSHNFNVIPKELKTAGQSIPTDDKLFVRITRRGGDAITSCYQQIRFPSTI